MELFTKCFLVVLATVQLFILSTSSYSFESHLKHFNQPRHPFYMDGKEWLMARNYIEQTFNDIGVEPEMHNFRTNISNHEGKVLPVDGKNIVGVLKGYTEDDALTSPPIILVGADYDTNRVTNPLKNNGGGVAILLELMKAFRNSVREGSYIQNATVVFVAFDLNTREYTDRSSGGQPGSYHFVHEWLPDFLRKSKTDLMGAIILDSVTTYNTQPGSQSLPNGFGDTFPEANEAIISSGSIGDYLAFLYTTRESRSPITEAFMKNYYLERIAREYRLQPMAYHFGSPATDSVLFSFNHQAHFHFWADGKPAYLLTDTGSLDRKDPGNEPCIVGCPADQFLTSERDDFMSHTTQTLLRTLLQIQATKANTSGTISLRANASVSIMTLITLFSVYFITKF